MVRAFLRVPRLRGHLPAGITVAAPGKWGTRVVAGVLKPAPDPCVFDPASYSKVGTGQNRDWILGTLTNLP